jgi:hypothetical protein
MAKPVCWPIVAIRSRNWLRSVASRKWLICYGMENYRMQVHSVKLGINLRRTALWLLGYGI